MEEVLFGNAWMNFLDNFYLNYNIIEYPKNMYFTANILSEYLKKNKNVYRKYPYAEKFDISSLNNIDWNKAIISFDKNLKIILAPEPIKNLINLTKRLNSEKAESNIFGGFQIPFFQIKSFTMIVVFMIIILFINICVYFNLIYRFQFYF